MTHDTDAELRTAGAIDIKALKGKINWKNDGRGNITFKGSIPLGEADLSALEDSYLDDFIEFNDGVDGNSGTFKKINGKKTTVVWKTKNDNGFRRTTKFKLKDNTLYITYKTRNGKGYATSLGFENMDTDGWNSLTCSIDLIFTVGSTVVDCRDYATLSYKTKAGKKTVFKNTKNQRTR